MAATDTLAIGPVCTRLLGRSIAAVDRIAGGRNSQVYRIECADGAAPRRFLAKHYDRRQGDLRDRLNTEFGAFAFVRRHGILSVPAPIARDDAAQCAVFEFIEGDRPSSAVTAADIDRAVGFVGDLRRLARLDEARVIPAASEACFSVAAILSSIDERVARLRALPAGAPGARPLMSLLETRFDPFRARCVSWCHDRLRARGVPPDRPLPASERTLSPSDFGFHNAVRRSDGSLVFVDFEYFGWDDPAKIAVDFVLHPAMALQLDYQRRFVDGLVSVVDGGAELSERIRIVYPLFGLKWALILLNEFIPAKLDHRSFAATAVQDREGLLATQIARTEQLIDRLDREFVDNPYVA